ncbi:DUF7548 family protein [Halegenticoccus soli]|uniref:DUF7548 family protein n=1 Tax=Halegenticoccus soli TaxID=1985678 RepID=UPI000C6D4A23|nr:hypothetical protein [Halegenticoccus soli]
MDTEDVAPAVGAVACLVLLAALAAPYAFLSAPEVGLAEYYASGPIGAAALAFFALVGVVVFLAGRNGSADPDVAAGIALVLGVSALGLSLLWALSINQTLLFSFPPEDAWLEYHRWAVVAAAGLVALSAVAYTRAALGV